MLVKKFNNQFYPSVFDLLFNDDNFDNIKKFSNPDYNVFENENEFSVELAAPGLKKENFKIVTNDDFLEISYEENEETKQENERYLYKGFCYGSFNKKFSLAQNIDKEKISAKYENGILRVTVPKKELAKTIKEIEIS